MKNRTVVPLHTYWEYVKAKEVSKNLSTKWAYTGLSIKDKAEYMELTNRIEAYERNPTAPNTIDAEKGNVDQTKEPI